MVKKKNWVFCVPIWKLFMEGHVPIFFLESSETYTKKKCKTNSEQKYNFAQFKPFERNAELMQLRKKKLDQISVDTVERNCPLSL